MQTIELLTQLITIESTHERVEKAGLHEIIDWVYHFFDSEDYCITRFEYNGYPSIVISNTEDRDVDIIFSGHLDVVYGDASLFVPRTEGDWLYGRGAMDMKCGVAVMMNVFKQHAATGPKMALMLTTDEEIGGFSGTKQLLDIEGYSAAVALIPDGGYAHHQIATKEKGIIRVQISVEGVSAHASRPWLGQNAIYTMMELIGDIRSYQDRLHQGAVDTDWYTTLNLSRLGGGEAMNTVPSEAVADFDIRFVETESPEEIIARLEDICAKYDAELEVLTVGANVYVEQSNPYLQQYQAAIESVGETVQYTRDYGASDARFFALHNIPTILSQPYGKDWHHPDERVSIKSVHMFEAIVDRFVSQFQR